MEYRDYYQILGVSRDADEQEIKKAFRKLAQQYHPDKNRDDKGSEQKFKEINEAYTVLSDADKRSKYDRFGSQWEQYGRMNSGAGRGGHEMSPEELDSILRQMGLGGVQGNGQNGGGFSSFFDVLFGQGMAPGGQGGSQYRPQRQRASEATVSVTLDEAFHGATRVLQSSDGARFEVNIPRGVKTGSKIRMRDAGGHGDIVLKVTVMPDSRFRRDGDNLRVTVPVDLITAVLGGELEVPTMERPVLLTIPSGTQGGKTIRLRGLGMPQLKNPAQRGDLLAEIEIRVPTHLSERERDLYGQLRDLSK